MATAWKQVRNETFCYLDNRHQYKMTLVHESSGGGRHWGRLDICGARVIDMNLGMRLTDMEAREKMAHAVARRLSEMAREALKLADMELVEVV